MRLGGDETQTRLVVDLSHKIDMRAFTLANPYRVVIDMPQVTFQLPAQDRREGPRPDQGVPLRPGDAGRLAHRASISPRPARIEKAFVLDAANDQPARLVLDLAAIDREAFMRTIALDNRAPDAAPQAASAGGADPAIQNPAIPAR